jgi:hypothetical protein
MELPNHLHLAPRVRWMEIHHLCPIRLHGVHRGNLTLRVWVSKKSIRNFHREVWNSKTTQKTNERTEELNVFSWKVAGSIHDGVIGVFHWQNPSARTMALGFDSASNRNEHQEYNLGGKGGRCIGLKSLPLSCADCLEIWETLKLLEPSGPVQACNGIVLPCIHCLLNNCLGSPNYSSPSTW